MSGHLTRALGTEGPSPAAVTRPLADLVAPLPAAAVHGDVTVPVSAVVYRSSDASPGALFFCVPGTHVDGHAFAAAAVENGATAIVCERTLDVGATQVVVPSVRAAMGPVAAAFFGRPADDLLLVGVTGTNGKTTTTYVLESIFRAAGTSTGVIGTTGVRVAGRAVPFDRTTPEAPDLQRLLARMRDERVGAVAMEVSSHGLDQRRVDGARFACAIFTNLTQDHLDYHGTLEAYFDAKARLFTAELADAGVVNVDAEHGPRLVERAGIPVTTFSVAGAPADVTAREIETTPAGATFAVGELRLRTRLRGLFNVSNCVGALAAARLVGVRDEAIAAGIEAIAGVPGRLEPVEAGQPFAVLVDYAHTPDSLDNVLRAAHGLTRRRVIVVFGCGGDRDRGKRPLMGRAATSLADLTVVTSDNPRSEDPAAIVSEIEPGAREGGGPYVVEVDRRAAIRLAVERAGEGDVVLIAGKGHETGQQFADRTIPFDDRRVAAEELAALDRGAR